MNYDDWKCTDFQAESDSLIECKPFPVWHFLSDDEEWEYWVTDPAEADDLMEQFAARGTPYTVTQSLCND